MEPTTTRIPRFSGWSAADQIRWFAWYLSSAQRKGTFTPDDIASAFKAFGVTPPPNLRTELLRLVRRKELTRDASGVYRLSRQIEDALQARYGGRDSAWMRTIGAAGSLDDFDLAERKLVEEMQLALRYGIFRSAVLLAWTLGYERLCKYILSHHADVFNRHLGRPISVATLEDFSKVAPAEVLRIARTIGIIPNDAYAVLLHGMYMRNEAVHASNARISEVAAKALVAEIIEKIMGQLPLKLPTSKKKRITRTRTAH